MMSQLKKNIYSLSITDNDKEKVFYVFLESNLFGHNDSISSVRFGYKDDINKRTHSNTKLPKL